MGILDVTSEERTVTSINFALAACALLSILVSAAAQDRMPPIPMEKMTDAQKKAAAELVAGPRGSLRGPFVPLLRSPEFMSRLQKMGEYLRFENSLGRKLTEFVILVTARQWTQQYEYDAHVSLALKAGVQPEIVAAIGEGRHPAGMASDEEIAYDLCSELRQNQSVSDVTFARAVSKFGEQGVIDMVGLTGYYSMLAMIMNVARTPMPEGKTPPLAPFPR
jgi:4-carboxymuconolactone decarboxylase